MGFWILVSVYKDCMVTDASLEFCNIVYTYLTLLDHVFNFKAYLF